MSYISQEVKAVFPLSDIILLHAHKWDKYASNQFHFLCVERMGDQIVFFFDHAWHTQKKKLHMGAHTHSIMLCCTLDASRKSDPVTCKAKTLIPHLLPLRMVC